MEIDEKKLKEMTDQANAKLDEFNDLLKKKADITVLEAKQKELVDQIAKIPDNAKELKELHDQLNAMDVKMQAYQMNLPGADESLAKQLEKALNTDDYKSASKRKNMSYDFNIKTNILTTSNSFTETNAPIIQRMYEPGIVSAPQRPTPIWDMISKSPINSDYAVMVERSAQTISAARVAEENTFAESYGGWTSYKYGVIKIAEYTKVTREKLEDWEYVRAEIMDMLTTNIPHIREGYFLTGYYATENWLGLINTTAQVAKDFAVPAGVISTPNAGVADVLLVAAMQVLLGNSANLANKQGFIANMAIVNPVDIANLQLHKDVNGQYVIPPFATANGVQVAGMKVVPSIYMTAGKFLVGDFTQAKAWVSRALNVNMWDQNASDPIYDLVTFTASHRLAFGVGATRAYAFVYGDITDGISAVIAGNAS